MAELLNEHRVLFHCRQLPGDDPFSKDKRQPFNGVYIAGFGPCSYGEQERDVPGKVLEALRSDPHISILDKKDLPKPPPKPAKPPFVAPTNIEPGETYRIVVSAAMGTTTLDVSGEKAISMLRDAYHTGAKVSVAGRVVKVPTYTTELQPL
jgi:hypothetical protein